METRKGFKNYAVPFFKSSPFDVVCEVLPTPLTSAMNTTDSSPILWGTRKPLPRSRRSTGSNMATACDQCHRCKVRCSGGRPSCERCQSYGSTCTYSLGKPLGKPPKNGRRKPLPSQPQSQPQPSRPPQFPTPHAHSPSNSHAGSAQNGGAGWCSLPENRGFIELTM